MKQQIVKKTIKKYFAFESKILGFIKTLHRRKQAVVYIYKFNSFCSLLLCLDYISMPQLTLVNLVFSCFRVNWIRLVAITFTRFATSCLDWLFCCCYSNFNILYPYYTLKINVKKTCINDFQSWNLKYPRHYKMESMN